MEPSLEALPVRANKAGVNQDSGFIIAFMRDNGMSPLPRCTQPGLLQQAVKVTAGLYHANSNQHKHFVRLADYSPTRIRYVRAACNRIFFAIPTNTINKRLTRISESLSALLQE